MQPCFAELLPLLQRSLSFVSALVVASIVSEIIAITVVSIPAYHIVRWRVRAEKIKARRTRHTATDVKRSASNH